MEAVDFRSHPFFNPTAIDDQVSPLTGDEITSFLDELDHNKDGFISYAEIESKLDAVHDEIAPEARPHNLHHNTKEDRARHDFLRTMIGTGADKIPRDEFADKVRSWKIPSMEQEAAEEEVQKEYMRRMTFFRRFKAYWAVHGPTIVFIAFVVGTMLAFGIWQCVKYVTDLRYRNALGWGVVMAKTCAGLLYPTMFFLLLSMCRYFSTFLRRSYRVSRFINWDLSQTFHIVMSCVALTLATMHAIGHLTGSFVWLNCQGGNQFQPQALDTLFGPDRPLRSYRDYASSLPGVTGITALGLFYLLALLSIPRVRRWSYELFQLGHLLMFPIIGLLMAHGTKGLLQFPMLGYFLAFPTLLILIERVTRLTVGFLRIPATIEILDSETIEIKATIPGRRLWNYAAGQYVFLQIPSISFFQWHPFTISVCQNKEFQLHIKTDGNWTKQLRAMGKEGQLTEIEIGIDGPFGAPAQRFYDFSHTILVGAGIGVTPFSGILADLQARENRVHGGPTDVEAKGPAGIQEVLGEKPTANGPKGRQDSGSSGTLDAAVIGNPKVVDSNEKTGGGVNVPAEASKDRKGRSRQASRDSNGGGSGSSTPLSRAASRVSLTLSRSRSRSRPGSTRQRNAPPPNFPSDYRRTDFHWMVRDKNHLTWFSDLLNSISRSQIWHRQHPDGDHLYPHLDIRMWTHVTQKRKSISTHIYRWLLELHRTPDHPESSLTGLINPTHYGRPDFVRILDQHYDDMLRYRAQTGWDMDGDGQNDRFKVGVFFCGTPLVGEILADRCRLLTARGRAEGTRVEYYFMMEVFG